MKVVEDVSYFWECSDRPAAVVCVADPVEQIECLACEPAERGTSETTQHDINTPTWTC